MASTFKWGTEPSKAAALDRLYTGLGLPTKTTTNKPLMPEPVVYPPENPSDSFADGLNHAREEQARLHREMAEVAANLRELQKREEEIARWIDKMERARDVLRTNNL